MQFTCTSTNAGLGEVMVEKTLRQDKIDLLSDLIDAVLGSRMSHDVYGTTKEDAYVSGINEGLGRACELIQEQLDKIKNDEAQRQAVKKAWGLE